jgi:hypothetical protein
MPQRYQPGDLITADSINNILARLENLEARLTALERRKDNAKETKEKEKDGAKETKEKDTKETKEKDTKETKDTKDTKEQSKDTKETKESKENKESKEAKEEKEDKDTTKEGLSLKEKENIRDQIPAPFDPNPAPAHFLLDAEEAGEPDGRAFILIEERPQVGRAAFDLADKQDDKLPEAGADGKQPEAFN